MSHNSSSNSSSSSEIAPVDPLTFEAAARAWKLAFTRLREPTKAERKEIRKYFGTKSKTGAAEWTEWIVASGLRTLGVRDFQPYLDRLRALTYALAAHRLADDPERWQGHVLIEQKEILFTRHLLHACARIPVNRNAKREPGLDRVDLLVRANELRAQARASGMAPKDDWDNGQNPIHLQMEIRRVKDPNSFIDFTPYLDAVDPEMFFSAWYTWMRAFSSPATPEIKEAVHAMWKGVASADDPMVAALAAVRNQLKSLGVPSQAFMARLIGFMDTFDPREVTIDEWEGHVTKLEDGGVIWSRHLIMACAIAPMYQQGKSAYFKKVELLQHAEQLRKAEE